MTQHFDTPLSPHEIGTLVLAWMHAHAARDVRYQHALADELRLKRALGHVVVTGDDDDGYKDYATGEPLKSDGNDEAWLNIDHVTDAAWEVAGDYPEPPFAWLTDDTVQGEDLLYSVGHLE